MKTLTRLSLLCVIATAAAACAAPPGEPVQGLAVAIKAPLSDNPFDDPETAFVAMVAEGPDIPADKLQVVKPYSPNMPLTLPAVPYGYGRGMRIELYSKDVNGQPTFPVRGRGRTVPKDVRHGETFLVHAFVTKTNAFSAPFNNANQEVITDGRVGASVIAMNNEQVLIAGGADPVAGATDVHDVKSWGNFKTVPLRYDIDTRKLIDLSAAPFSTSLSQGRAFMAAARGSDGIVALTGGYTLGASGPEASKMVEYFDPKDSKIKQAVASDKPNLQFARAHHTVTRMFDNNNYFMVIGGKGPESQASRTWEIWHPEQGRLAFGELSIPRWNHATVRLPEKDGGYMMLIGGENDNGTINNFEVIRYDGSGNVAHKHNNKITCCLPSGTCASDAECNAWKSQPGYSEYKWQPLLRELNGGGRTQAAAAYVHNTTPRYNLVYIVGGFEDTQKKKPMTRVDVFNIETGKWVDSVQQLQAPRGAPIMGWSTAGAQRGQVIVTGGVDAQGKTIASGELLSYDSTSGKVMREWSSNELPNGGAVFGQAASLSTGHVFIAGGASSGDSGLKASATIRLYNPK
ncbi:MAG: hypothetical protein KC502_03055 [Myxococcales bacterium]|nr:hypothetical protein [Myxococcales bacterium]